MVLKQIVAYCRLALPVCLGICIGVALSLIILPLMEEGTCVRQNESPESSNREFNHNEENMFMKNIDLESFRSSQYEPNRIKTSKSGSKSSQKPFRYKFAASELDIKNTLLVAYMTTVDQLDRRALAINRTLNQQGVGAPPVMFFANGKPQDSHTLPLVTFNLASSKVLPLVTLRYLMNQFSHKYKYFMILPDTVYIKSLRIKDLLESTQADTKSYIGIPSVINSQFCDVNKGFILSQSVVEQFKDFLVDCGNFLGTNDDVTEAMGNCISLVTQQSCTNKIASMGMTLNAFEIDSEAQGISSYTSMDDFKQSLIYSSIGQPQTFYHIHRHVAKEEMASTVKSIEQIRQHISHMFDSINELPPWPLAVPRQYNTTNRYNVIRWTMVEQNTSHLEWDYVNSAPLTGYFLLLGAHLIDQEEIIDLVMENLNTAAHRYTLDKVHEVYHRVDPTRGMEYVLTLTLYDKVQNELVMKTFELVKPLTDFEIVPQPFHMDTAKTYILVPVTRSDTDVIRSLIDSFEKASSNDQDIILYLTLIYSDKEYKEAASQRDIHSSTKNLIKLYLARKTMKINFLTVHGDKMSNVEAVVKAVQALPQDSIVMTMTATTDIRAAYINRARANTIKGAQIYAPIAFWHYDPILVYENAHIDVARSNGHFGEDWFDHVSFYAADLMNVWFKAGSTPYPNIVDLFLAHSTTHVFRSADPDLVVNHHEQQCTASLNEVDGAQCAAKLVDNIGSAPLLARSLFKKGVL